MGDPTEPSGAYPTHHSIVVLDVAGFSARSDPDQVRVRAALYAVLRQTWADAGIDWDGCSPEDRGDGVLLIVPASVSTVRLLERIPSELAQRLTEYNAGVDAPLRLRLRMAVHTGEVHRDPNGLSGAAVTAAFRLLDADPLRAVLAASRSDFVLIVSDAVHRNVVMHGYPGIDAAGFQQARVQVKETRTLGWIHVPGARPPLPGLGRAGWLIGRRAAVALAGLLLAGAAALAWAGFAGSVSEVVPTLPLDGVAATAHQPTCTGCNVGRTYSQQATPTGATTFANPFTFGGRGTRVAFNQRVEVICKLYAPSAPSVLPGHWYLLATPPWNGRYYSPANSYVNGGGHGPDDDPDVDPGVPDCCPADRPCDS